MLSREQQAELSWYVPGDERATTFRTRLLKIFVATLIFVGPFWVFAAKSLRLPGLAALLPLVALLTLLAWKTSAHGRTGNHNVHLSAGGLGWRDADGATGRLPRDRIVGFRIGLDPDTIRAIPALTLILVGGFESQPVELHAPATPARVRAFLSDELGIAEDSLSDTQLAVQLYHALLAALDTLPDDAEVLVLRYALVQPVRQPTGSWLVCSIPDRGDVYYDPATWTYRFVSPGSDDVVLLELFDLLAYVRKHVVPLRMQERMKFIADLQQKAAHRERAAWIRDVRCVGFFVEIDARQRWNFVGSRSGLVKLCDEIEAAAMRLQPAPVGARPSTLLVGSRTAGVTIQVGNVDGVDDYVICGSPAYLCDLSRRIRQRLADAAVESQFHLATPDDLTRATVFSFRLRGDDFDPADHYV